MPKRAVLVAALAAVTVLVGVVLFAARCDRAELGDGPLPFRDVTTAGVLLLVLPWSVFALVVLWRSVGTVAPVAVSTAALAVAVALDRPGNLFAVAWVAYFTGAAVLLVVLETLLRRVRRRRHPISQYRGRFKSSGPSTDVLRQQERAADSRAEAEKAHRVGHSAG